MFMPRREGTKRSPPLAGAPPRPLYNLMGVTLETRRRLLLAECGGYLNMVGDGVMRGFLLPVLLTLLQLVLRTLRDGVQVDATDEV